MWIPCIIPLYSPLNLYLIILWILDFTYILLLLLSLVPNRSKSIRYGKRLIGTSAATLWNALPNHIKSARNVIRFKRLLKVVLQQPIPFHPI